MRNQRRLRVCINARLIPERMGGVEQLTSGLLKGLSQLADPDLQVMALAADQSLSWLENLNYPGIEIVPPPRSSFRKKVLRLASRVVTNKRIRRLYVTGRSRLDPNISPSDGTVERLRADLVHFPFQMGFSTSVPSIYQPHDLQHIHLPEFFSEAERRIRTRTYAQLCNQAKGVVVVSDWVRNDLIQHMELPAHKIWVLPYAPPNAAPQAQHEPGLPPSVAERLPTRYLLYPAQTWPHKNHIGLFRALAQLRDNRGSSISMVCTGRRNEHFDVLRAELRRLNLEEQVTFLDYVSPQALATIFRGARGTVVPTRFEAASFPIWEAFSAGSAVACSNVTSLPEQVGDAALLFDPLNIDQIADCIHRLWFDDEMVEELARKGRQRVAELSWLRSAEGFATLYKSVVGQRLSESEKRIRDWSLAQGDHFKWPA